MVRTAIIGTGAVVTKRYLPALETMEQVELVAICGRHAERRGRLVDEHGIARGYADYRDLLAAEFDAVIICTPHYLHEEMTVAAAQNGKHVLVEKPIANTREQARRMIDACNDAGVTLMVAHSDRYRPGFTLARRLLSRGLLGRVESADVRFGHGGPAQWGAVGPWFADADLVAGGALLDLGVHKADLLRWLLDDDIVDARGCTSPPSGGASVEDTAVAVLRFDGGAIASLSVSWSYRYQPENELVLMGTEGRLRVFGRGADHLELHQADALDGPLVWAPQAVDPPSGPHQRLLFDFFRCVEQGTEPPVTGSDGYDALNAVLQVYESDERRQSV